MRINSDFPSVKTINLVDDKHRYPEAESDLNYSHKFATWKEKMSLVELNPIFIKEKFVYFLKECKK